MQVGINNDETSIIKVDTSLEINDFKIDILSENTARASLDKIDAMISTVTNKNTMLGATVNRLTSVLDSNIITSNSFKASISIIKDADIAQESSNFIKSQILQETTATLLTTANQSPNIALILI